MYNKSIRYFTSICLLSIFLLFSLFHEEKIQEINYETVIFKDDSQTLIPVSLPVKKTYELEDKYRSIIETMKSLDYIDIGLYPLLHQDLEVHSIYKDNNTLKIDFSDDFHISNNEEALDLCETLSYLFCHDDIESVDILIDHKKISNFNNSSIPVSCINKDLGINNFEYFSNNLYNTSCVTIYNEKRINNQTYYVPITTRIDTTYNNIDECVSLLLDNFKSNKTIRLENECYNDNGHLHVFLDDVILDNSESIDDSLYLRLEKSLLSLPHVSKVSLYINGQLLDQTINYTIDNRIRL